MSSTVTAAAAATAGKIGVLLVNLGTPDAPTTVAVRRYLAEFLSDPRVVEIPRLVWQPILRGVILNLRPSRSARAYRQVWTEQGSPLAAITARQAEALRGAFGQTVVVDHAMRYGRPAIGQRINALMAQGCDRILVAALYPQYSAATTASVADATFAALASMRYQPALRTLPPYHDHPAYISALAASVRDGVAALEFRPDALVASFHGMPQRTYELGDPYRDQCHRTVELLGAELGLDPVICFQSRFGPAKWLEPSTDATLERLAREGKRRVAIFAPGFAADCLETLEELAIRGREQFLAAGGESFAYLPCLNDSAAGVTMLAHVIGEQLEGWMKPA